MKTEALTRWTPENSAELYRVRNWGAGYFDISETGTVVVKPHGVGSKHTIDLLDIVRNVKEKGYDVPVLLRFSGILESQIDLLNRSFDKAIKELSYKGTYRGVYPIKVNQKQQVVRDIIAHGNKYHHGLEAGSKAELIAAIAYMKDPEALIICNGYKDSEFIDLALHSLKMGLRTFLVVEIPAELELILERAKQIGVKPLLGVRAKLSSRAGGRWDKSGGDRSKFGLNASQIIEVVEQLREANMLDCLQMLHYHLGSQVPDIRKVRLALQEACRFFVNIFHEGASLNILNVGGGLAIDYDGSSTNFASSRNYSMAEYAADVVEEIMNIFDESNVTHPMIVSESGRATVAHHSVLLFNILHARRFDPQTPPIKLPTDASEILENLAEVRKTLNPRNAQEAYHDAMYYRDEIRSMFLRGTISLRERALAEDIFWHIIRKIADTIQGRKYVPEEMDGLEPAIADIYYGNFSLFQSLPDSWAIDQLFPVMPIHRLDEIPTRQAVLADITCDSDGQVDTFIDLRDVTHVLPLHELNHEEYYLGAFLVGAYQETLGDMHNLLGNTNIIHINTDEDGNIHYAHEIPGDTVEDVLSAVEYNPEDILKELNDKTSTAEQEKKISTEEKEIFLQAFEDGMKGYTYFEK